MSDRRARPPVIGGYQDHDLNGDHRAVFAAIVDVLDPLSYRCTDPGFWHAVLDKALRARCAHCGGEPRKSRGFCAVCRGQGWDIGIMSRMAENLMGKK